MNELLKQIRERELREISLMPAITHGPTIGNRYEDATFSILENSIFPNDLFPNEEELFKQADLKVVSGFIKTSGGLSKQIDCMIVTGEGEKLTKRGNDFLYDIKQVIAVIEVKKNLFKNQLEDAYINSQSVIDFNSIADDFNYFEIRNPFRHITKRPLRQYEELSRQEQAIMASLVADYNLPIRVILGYEGFSTEEKLKSAFWNFLNSSIYSSTEDFVAGFGPVNLPNLIICRDYSLIKLNGMPYTIDIEKRNNWNIYGSYYKDPLLLLVEILWYKLVRTFTPNINIFEGSLNIEKIVPFIECSFPKDKGWIYNCYDLEKINLIYENDTEEWKPTEVNISQASLLMKLGLNSDSMEESNFYNKQDIDSLESDRIIYRDDGKIRYLTDEATLVFTPSGETYVGDANDGFFQEWTKQLRQNIGTHNIEENIIPSKKKKVNTRKDKRKISKKSKKVNRK